LFAAVQKLFPGSRLRIEHSMSQGFFCLLDRKVSERGIFMIADRMKSLIERDIPIRKKTLRRSEAVRLFEKNRQFDKVILLQNSRLDAIKVYSLLDCHDTFAIAPLGSTGDVGSFYLRNFPPGFVMVFPHWQDFSRLPGYLAQPRLARIFNEYLEWVRILGITDVGELNAAIRGSRGPEIIKISEALHEKKIVYIADRITREKRKILLIAGPSSAGKTTFTKRLSIQLMVNGLRPVIISTDDYFFPHSRTPRDEYGRLDFESISTVDIPLLNSQLLSIINGRRVTMPGFNFITGRRRTGREIRLPENGVVMIEGIHCLNEKLTYRIPKPLKFRIYISALTQLNIDDHNRISTTDTRMMRRIVRDTYYRGYSVKGVLSHWSSVRRGEERNIYPFQEQADEMFNSALIYEPAVLRKYCVPIIKRVKKKEPVYEEAKRLLDFFELFYDLDERDVPSNSILREFIGGSSFVY
jgi:uridine kinase